MHHIHHKFLITSMIILFIIGGFFLVGKLQNLDIINTVFLFINSFLLLIILSVLVHPKETKKGVNKKGVNSK